MIDDPAATEGCPIDENQGQVILTNGAAEQLLHRLQGGA